MIKFIACPVCGVLATQDECWTDGQGILEESHTDCYDCGYQDYFEYGAYYVQIDDQVWEWSYTSPEDEVRRIRQEIESAKRVQAAQEPVTA